MKTEEPLARAQAGAYALLMASRDLDDEDERRAIDRVAFGIVLDLRKIKKRWNALNKSRTPKESPPPWVGEKPASPSLVGPDTA